MSEHEPVSHEAAHAEHSPWGTVLEVGGIAHALAEASEATHIAHLTHGLSSAATTAVTEGALVNGAGASAGSYLAPLALANGAYTMYENSIGHEGPMSLQNWANLGAGGLETFSGGVGTLGLAGAGASALGFTGTGASMMTAAASAGPAAMIAGAGAAGYGLGSLAAQHMTGNKVDGLFGKDDTGRDRDVNEWAADNGIAAENMFQGLLGIKEGGDGFWNTTGDLVGDAIGGTIATRDAIVGTAVGLGVEGVSGAGHAIGGMMDWLGGMGGAITNMYTPSFR